MNMNIVNEITARQLRHDIPKFSSGDTIRERSVSDIVYIGL